MVLYYTTYSNIKIKGRGSQSAVISRLDRGEIKEKKENL
jgi:hypothetical protein